MMMTIMMTRSMTGSGNSLDSHSEDSRFKSQLVHRLS
jgi:hypothetical protein